MPDQHCVCWTFEETFPSHLSIVFWILRKFIKMKFVLILAIVLFVFNLSHAIEWEEALEIARKDMKTDDWAFKSMDPMVRKATNFLILEEVLQEVELADDHRAKIMEDALAIPHDDPNFDDKMSELIVKTSQMSGGMNGENQ
ncbi:uncharacterized protein LOC141857065 [Brevipalpus obovatus]|uniref:uncharacterized protein LOC141857065 n=1 Tax=Brevipalpus obovatus TaxID=246614 RepID=UPI003D9DBFFF